MNDQAKNVQFDWIPIYLELGKRILDYENRQGELLDLLREAESEGIKVFKLTDQDTGGNEIPLEEIDPFTFFACFNRSAKAELRRAFLAFLKRQLDLEAPVPESFTGIPIAFTLASWFFAYKKERRPEDIPTLWKLARQAVEEGRDGIDPELFQQCRKIRSVALPKLTIGLFWLRPDEFLPYDKKTRAFLASRGIQRKATSYETYLEIMDEASEKLGGSYPEISYQAWLFGKPPVVPKEAALKLVQRAQRVLPGWTRFTDPVFEQEERDDKLEAAEVAQKELDPESLQRLLQQERYDSFSERLQRVAAATNLLRLQVPSTSDLSLLHREEIPKAQLYERIFDLLHGEGESPERLGRFSDWLEEIEQPAKWTFPTYFLFLLNPEEELFIEPSVTRKSLKKVGIKHGMGKGCSAEAYEHLLAIGHELLEHLEDHGARDMIDIQSLLWLAAQPAKRRFWKIAPGEGARKWGEWRDKGIATIGWDRMGDLTGFDREAFESRRDQCCQEIDDYKPQGMEQLWTFRDIAPGDKVVANQGKSRVVGVGEVTEPYYYVPDTEHAHRLKVHWRDTTPRDIPTQGNWQWTLVELTEDEFETLTGDPPPPPPPSGPLLQRLLAHLGDQGLHFPPELVSNYLLALQAKRFVLLTGISGTGKTRLALETAVISAGSDEQPGQRNFVLEAVRPDWTDNRGLLGYHNPLTGKYLATPFLRLLLEAGDEAERAAREDRSPRPYFAILDEMNLARVEHYFSDFLSALESGEELRLHEVPELAATDAETGDPIPMKLSIPENLFFVGTVNIDESTYMFSPKVLDRAFTLELNEVDLAGYSGDETDDDSVGLSADRTPGLLTFERSPNRDDWDAFGQLLDGEMRDRVVALNQLLAAENRHFGYRVANEISRFLVLAKEQTAGNREQLEAALDLALFSKVLPKLHGTQQELQEPLDQLFAFAVTGDQVADLKTVLDRNWQISEGALADLTVSTEEVSPLTPRLPRTAAKLFRMRTRLRQQGFTSFIE